VFIALKASSLINSDDGPRSCRKLPSSLERPECAVNSRLVYASISGEGQWVQTSLLQSQIFMLDFQAVQYLMKGGQVRELGAI
jgi:hypothetical protein